MQSGKPRCELNQQTYRNYPNWLLRGGGRHYQLDKVERGVLLPPTPWHEAIHLSIQKGSERGCKALEEGPDTRSGYNSFSCIVIGTFSILAFFLLLFPFFSMLIRSELVRILLIRWFRFQFCQQQILTPPQCASFLPITRF